MLTLLIVGQLFAPADRTLTAAGQTPKTSQPSAEVPSTGTFLDRRSACGMPTFVPNEILDAGISKRLQPEIGLASSMRVVKPPVCGEFDSKHANEQPPVRFGSGRPPALSPAPPREK